MKKCKNPYQYNDIIGFRCDICLRNYINGQYGFHCFNQQCQNIDTHFDICLSCSNAQILNIDPTMSKQLDNNLQNQLYIYYVKVNNLENLVDQDMEHNHLNNILEYETGISNSKNKKNSDYEKEISNIHKIFKELIIQQNRMKNLNQNTKNNQKKKKCVVDFENFEYEPYVQILYAQQKYLSPPKYEDFKFFVGHSFEINDFDEGLKIFIKDINPLPKLENEILDQLLQGGKNGVKVLNQIDLFKEQILNQKIEQKITYFKKEISLEKLNIFGQTTTQIFCCDNLSSEQREQNFFNIEIKYKFTINNSKSFRRGLEKKQKILQYKLDKQMKNYKICKNQLEIFNNFLYRKMNFNESKEKAVNFLIKTIQNFDFIFLQNQHKRKQESLFFSNNQQFNKNSIIGNNGTRYNSIVTAQQLSPKNDNLDYNNYFQKKKHQDQRLSKQQSIDYYNQTQKFRPLGDNNYFNQDNLWLLYEQEDGNQRAKDIILMQLQNSNNNSQGNMTNNTKQKISNNLGNKWDNIKQPNSITKQNTYINLHTLNSDKNIDLNILQQKQQQQNDFDSQNDYRRYKSQNLAQIMQNNQQQQLQQQQRKQQLKQYFENKQKQRHSNQGILKSNKDPLSSPPQQILYGNFDEKSNNKFSINDSKHNFKEQHIILESDSEFSENSSDISDSIIDKNRDQQNDSSIKYYNQLHKERKQQRKLKRQLKKKNIKIGNVEKKITTTADNYQVPMKVQDVNLQDNEDDFYKHPVLKLKFFLKEKTQTAIYYELNIVQDVDSDTESQSSSYSYEQKSESQSDLKSDIQSRSRSGSVSGSVLEKGLQQNKESQRFQNQNQNQQDYYYQQEQQLLQRDSQNNQNQIQQFNLNLQKQTSQQLYNYSEENQQVFTNKQNSQNQQFQSSENLLSYQNTDRQIIENNKNQSQDLYLIKSDRHEYEKSKQKNTYQQNNNYNNKQDIDNILLIPDLQTQFLQQFYQNSSNNLNQNQNTERQNSNYQNNGQDTDRQIQKYQVYISGNVTERQNVLNNQDSQQIITLNNTNNLKQIKNINIEDQNLQQQLELLQNDGKLQNNINDDNNIDNKLNKTCSSNRQTKGVLKESGFYTERNNYNNNNNSQNKNKKKIFEEYDIQAVKIDKPSIVYNYNYSANSKNINKSQNLLNNDNNKEKNFNQFQSKCNQNNENNFYSQYSSPQQQNVNNSNGLNSTQAGQSNESKQNLLMSQKNSYKNTTLSPKKNQQKNVIFNQEKHNQTNINSRKNQQNLNSKQNQQIFSENTDLENQILEFNNKMNISKQKSEMNEKTILQQQIEQFHQKQQNVGNLIHTKSMDIKTEIPQIQNNGIKKQQQHKLSQYGTSTSISNTDNKNNITEYSNLENIQENTKIVGNKKKYKNGWLKFETVLVLNGQFLENSRCVTESCKENIQNRVNKFFTLDRGFHSLYIYYIIKRDLSNIDSTDEVLDDTSFLKILI